MYNRELEDKSFEEVKNLSIDEILEKIKVAEYSFDLIKLKIERYCNDHEIDIKTAKVGEHEFIRESSEVMADLMTIVLGYTRAILQKRQ